MWYRKAQVQPGVVQNNQPIQTPPAQQEQGPQSAQQAQPALKQTLPVVDPEITQAAISTFQTGINNILNQTGKTYLQIITELNNLKSSNESNQALDQNTKNSINAILDSNITSVTNSAAGNFNKDFVPVDQNQQTTPELVDLTNPAARLINPTNSVNLPGQGGLLKRDAIEPRVIEPQTTAPNKEETKPGTTLNKAAK
jgi:hypothetical protein